MPRNLYCNVLGSSPHVQNLVSKIFANIANVWFQKTRVSSRSRNVQVSVSSRVFARSLSLVSVSQRQCLVSVSQRQCLVSVSQRQCLGLEDSDRDSSSGQGPRIQAQAFSKKKVFKIFFQAISNSLAYPEFLNVEA